MGLISTSVNTIVNLSVNSLLNIMNGKSVQFKKFISKNLKKYIKTMKIENGRYQISHISDLMFENRLIVPDYQRDFCWNNEQILLLIDSVMNDITIGLFQFREIGNRGRNLEVVDGLHRIRCVLNVLFGNNIYFSFDEKRFTTNETDFDYKSMICENSPFISSRKLKNGKELTDEQLYAFVDAYEKFRRLDLMYITYIGTDEEVKNAFDRINQSGVVFTPIFTNVSNTKLFKL